MNPPQGPRSLAKSPRSKPGLHTVVSPGAMLDISVTKQYTLRARKYTGPQREGKDLRVKHRDWMAEGSSKTRGINSSYY